MKVRIEAASGYDSGLGHSTRMLTLAKELCYKYNADVNICMPIGEIIKEQIIILDMDDYGCAVSRMLIFKNRVPNVPVIVFDNDNWKDIYNYTENVIVPNFDNIILQEGFRKTEPERLNNEVKVIFLNQGGSDPWGLAPRILHALELLNVRNTIFVLVGKETHDLTYKQLIAFKKETSMPLLIEYNKSPVDVWHLMYSSDLAITAPGQTFAELASMWVPSIIIGHHDRHDKIAREIANKQAAINLGMGVGMKDRDLVTNLRLALNTMSIFEERQKYARKAKALVNVNGIDRITKYIWDVYNETYESSI